MDKKELGRFAKWMSLQRSIKQSKGLSMLEITLPWPPKELSPNARTHWAKLAKTKKAYRSLCAWHAKAQGAKKIEAEALNLEITFYPPSRRAFDLDNALASCKSGLDGLADVLGVDDSQWSLTIKKAETVGGFVKIIVCKSVEKEIKSRDSETGTPPG
jgi:crossover junction endodeoxyribonuclease RusA